MKGYILLAALLIFCFQNTFAQQWVDDTTAKRLHIKTLTVISFSVRSKTTDSTIEWYDTSGNIIKSMYYNNDDAVAVNQPPVYRLRRRENFIRNNKEQLIYENEMGYLGFSVSTDSFPDKTHYTYNLKGDVKSETKYYYHQDSVICKYSYNKQGLNTSMREKGLKIKFYYNSKNELIKTKDRGSYGGGYTINRYNNKQQQIESLDKDYDKMEKSTSIHEYKNTFNNLGQIIKDTVLETNYYKKPNKPEIFKYATTLYYDSNGLLTKMVDSHIGPTSDISPFESIDTYTYTYY